MFGQALHILLVDDDEIDRMAIRRALKAGGPTLHFVEAESCAEALERLQVQSFDCMFLDYRLPDGNGLSLIEHLRAQGYRLPVVVLTGQGDEATAVRLMKAGAADYLSKDAIGRDNLAVVLRNVLRVAQAEAEAQTAQQLLRESEERYRLVLEGSNDGIWDWDLGRQQLFMSDRFFEILGLDCHRYTLRTPWPLYRRVHPEDRPWLRSAFEMGLRGDKGGELEVRIRHSDGEWRYCQIRYRVCRDLTGRLIRLAGILSDVSARHWAEQERQRLLEGERQARAVAEVARREAELANRRKDEFLATVTHELRTPLNPIIGWAQLLRRGKMAPEQQAQALEVIERNAKLQKQLIEDLLDISRIIRGKFTLDLTPIALPPLVRSATEAVRQSAQGKHLRLVSHLPPEVPPVNADAVRLQQVIWNLLTNAIKFTPDGGRVGIRLETLGSHLRLTVADTGIGIAPEFLPHVFEQFRQADTGTTRKQGGLGLGLFIVRHIVEAHGGRVYATSAGEGQGATFTVELPVHAAPAPLAGSIEV